VILALAEQLDSLHTAACERLTPTDDGIPLRYWVGLRVAGVLFRVDHWLSLPWRCRLAGHLPERRESYNLDACAVEEAWLECGRCGEWLRHLEEGIHARR
jgi:hypothetical protein